jgi:hypothetical protein
MTKQPKIREYKNHVCTPTSRRRMTVTVTYGRRLYEIRGRFSKPAFLWPAITSMEEAMTWINDQLRAADGRVRRRYLTKKTPNIGE